MVTTSDLTEFSAICRTCLSKSEDLHPIFPDISRQTDDQFLDSFFTITGLKVKIDDGLPQNICEKCADLFKSTENFRTTCKEAEKMLLNMQEKIKDTIKKEVILPEATLLNEELNVSTEQDLVKTEIKEHEIYKKYKFKHKNQSNKNNFREMESGIIADKKVKESMLYILDVTDSKQKRVICMLCQKRLLIKSFWTHMSRSHPGVDNRQVKCDLCDNYIMKEKMNRHKKLMHGNSFKCRYCKSEFKEKDTLVEHVSSCPEKKKRKDYETSREMVECDICSKTMQKGSLRVHKAIKHAGLGPVCDRLFQHCGKRFGNKLRLDEHYRAKHGYEKFKCSECEFQSASIIALKNHERRHRGEKPFVCETCGADFHAAYLLVQHRHSHRTDKRFKCEKCPASFKARNSLHTHTRSCHAQTRVTCSVCARAYSCRHYALKHMRAVHRYTGPVPPLHTHTAHDAVSNK